MKVVKLDKVNTTKKFNIEEILKRIQDCDGYVITTKKKIDDKCLDYDVFSELMSDSEVIFAAEVMKNVIFNTN